MKTLGRVLAAFLVMSVLFVGCRQTEEKKEEAEKKDVEMTEQAGGIGKDGQEGQSVEEQGEKRLLWNVGGLKGPTSIGMIEMIDKYASSEEMKFSIYGAIDELSAKLMSGEVDIATVPANLASVLYNKSKGAIKVAAINTLGVTAIVEKGDGIQSLQDLKGRTLAATGKGAVPEATLRLMLEKAGLNPDEDVTMEWKSEPSEAMAWLSLEGNDVAMLPQPFATLATKKIEKLRIALDLSEEWTALSLPGDFITGVLVVKSDLVERERERFMGFLDEYRASIKFSKSSEEAPKLIAKYGIIDEKMAKMVLPNLNILYIDGEEMKTSMEAYLSLLHGEKPEFIGGSLPDEAFYFIP